MPPCWGAGPTGPTSARDSLRTGFALGGRKRGPATQLTTACMPPRQAGRSLPRAGATCTWQLAMWGSVPRQLTRWIQKEFFWVRLFSLEDKGDAGGEGVEGSSGLREARHVPFCTLPPGDSPHLDFGSFIFKFQTFLGRRK